MIEFSLLHPLYVSDTFKNNTCEKYIKISLLVRAKAILLKIYKEGRKFYIKLIIIKST